MKLLLIVCAFLAGCSSVKVDVTKPDGGECHASRTAFFMSAAEISGEICGGKIGVKGSGADTEALSAVTSAAISAAINSVVPMP